MYSTSTKNFVVLSISLFIQNFLLGQLVSAFSIHNNHVQSFRPSSRLPVGTTRSSSSRHQLHANYRNDNYNDSYYDDMDDEFYSSVDSNMMYQSKPQQQLQKQQNYNDKNNELLKNTIIPQIEKEIIASANAKLDVKRVKDALTTTSKNKTEYENDYLYPIATDADNQPSNSLNIALASGMVLGLFTFLSLHTYTLAAIVFIITTFIASRDPLNETDDNISGPLFRIIGRETLQSIEKSKPKVKAVARAVISNEDELIDLKQRVAELEMENDQMKLWIERRTFVDENGQFYSLDTLKNMARMKGIQVSGTKAQIMMRLIEVGSIKIV